MLQTGQFQKYDELNDQVVAVRNALHSRVDAHEDQNYSRNTNPCNNGIDICETSPCNFVELRTKQSFQFTKYFCMI